MDKRKLCFILIFSFLLTGCSDVKMSQAESGQVSEYIAYSLLKFNKNPEILITKNEEENNLNSEATSQVEKENPEKVEASKNPTSQPDSEKPVEKPVSAGDVFGSSALSITVSKSKLYSSYPEDDEDSYFSLSTPKGEKLLVIDLIIKNTGDDVVKFKTNNGGISYTLSESSGKALTTLLENDIHFFNTKIKPGKKIEAKLVYQVSEKYELGKGKIQISNKDKKIELPIK